MGPILYTMYAAHIGNTIRENGLSYHIHADDTQIYILFEMDEVDTATARIALCAAVIRAWMKADILKLSEGKTELIYITRKESQTISAPSSATIGNNILHSVKQVRNLGMMFDEHMKMDAQISSVCSAGHFHLRNIGMIRKYLTADSAECLVHAFIASRLNHSNALLYGIPAYQLSRLQRLQNAAARVVSRTKKYEHITPLLKNLCWLAVESRIKNKLFLLTFKSLAPLYLYM